MALTALFLYVSDAIVSSLVLQTRIQASVRLFIDAGASVDSSIVNYKAVTCPAIFEMLVEAGTPTDHLKCFGMGIFHKCLEFLTPETAVKVFERVLLSPAVDPTIKDIEHPDSGDLLIYMAARRGNLELVQLLLNTKKFSLTRNTLASAVKSQNEQLILFLLKQGASADIRTSWGSTPLSEAIYLNKPEITRLFEFANTQEHMMDYDNCSAALEASFLVRNFDLAQRLLNFGVTRFHWKALTAGLIAAIIAGRGKSKNETIVRALLDSPDIFLTDVNFLVVAVE